MTTLDAVTDLGPVITLLSALGALLGESVPRLIDWMRDRKAGGAQGKLRTLIREECEAAIRPLAVRVEKLEAGAEAGLEPALRGLLPAPETPR